MSLNSFLYGYDDTKVNELQILSIENRGANVFINFSVSYPDGTDKAVRLEARKLPSRYEESDLAEVICAGRANCNPLKSDRRILFVATLKNGTKCLLQEKEGTPDCNRLLQLQAKSPEAKQVSASARADKKRSAAKNALAPALEPILDRWDPMKKSRADGYPLEAEQIARLVTEKDDVHEIGAILFAVFRHTEGKQGPSLKECAASAFEIWTALGEYHTGGNHTGGNV